MTVLHCRLDAPRVPTVLLLIGAALLSACGGTPQATQGLLDPAADMAEKSFVDAVRKGDAGALGNLLDASFVWIAVNGKTFSRADTLQNLPKPALADETGADATRFTYSEAVHTVTINSGKMHILRVWAKRPEGWRALVYQEVQSLDAPLAVTPGVAANCENPCKSLPFTPQDDVQKGVAAAYMELESAAVARDAPLWSLRTAYEFLAASSYTTQALDKNTRMAQLAQKSLAGLSPTPLMSAAMQEFPGVVVMRSRHQPDRGNPLEVTRVWIRRNDMWIIMLSFQTAVQPA